MVDSKKFNNALSPLFISLKNKKSLLGNWLGGIFISWFSTMKPSYDIMFADDIGPRLILWHPFCVSIGTQNSGHGRAAAPMNPANLSGNYLKYSKLSGPTGSEAVKAFRLLR